MHRFGAYILYANIDRTLVNSLHGLLNCEIGGLDCHVITTEYITRVHVTPIFNALVHVNHSVVSFVYNTISQVCGKQ